MRHRTAHPSGGRILSGLILLIMAACASGSTTTTTTTTATMTTTTTTTPAAEAAAVDGDLGIRAIAVTGAPVVGEPLTAAISPDLEGRIQSWGWHRCIRIPTCQTVTGADGPGYTPTTDDAWHVLRVIAVAERDGQSPGAVSVVVGPVTNPDPAPFTHNQTIDPSQPTGLRLIVGPGQVRVRVDASCPVLVVAGIRTPAPDDAPLTAQHSSEEQAARHDFALDGDGGQLTVGVVGECDGATVAVDAVR